MFSEYWVTLYITSGKREIYRRVFLEGVTMRIFNKCLIVHCLLLGFVLAGAGFAMSPQVLLVWGQKDNMKHNIYFSQQVDGKWATPIVLASGDHPNVLPTLIKNFRNEVWVVWIGLDNGKGTLRYRHLQNGEWGGVAEIQTSTETDMAPSLQVDAHGVAWLVWAGVDGDDDIYFCHWTEAGWTVPQLLNLDDFWPDILPRLAINENRQLQVTWSGFNGKRYVDYFSIWDGQQWTLEKEHDTLPDGEKVSSKTGDYLPQFVDDASQAALYLEKTDGQGDVYYRDQLK